MNPCAGLIARRAVECARWVLPSTFLAGRRLVLHRASKQARRAFVRSNLGSGLTWRQLAQAAKRAGLYSARTVDKDAAFSLMRYAGAFASSESVDQPCAGFGFQLPFTPSPGAGA